MKMMINTSSTSIIGVMLISAFGPPDPPPTAIPINQTPYVLLLLCFFCGFEWSYDLFLNLLGQKTQRVDPASPHVVDDIHHFLIAGALVGLDVASLVQFVAQHVLDLLL